MSNWFNILKEQKTIADTGITFTLPEEEPEESEDEDCIKWLKGLYDIFVKHKDADLSSQAVWQTQYQTWTNNPSEELACMIKKYLQNPPRGIVSSDEHDDNGMWWEWNFSKRETGQFVNLEFYFSDWAEATISVGGAFRVSIGCEWRGIVGAATDWEAINKLNDAYLEIFKYIGDKGHYTYWRNSLLGRYNAMSLKIWGTYDDPKVISRRAEGKKQLDEMLNKDW